MSYQPNPVFTAFAQNGTPLAGGKLNTYIAGTTTPQATFTDNTLTIQNTNPVILNSSGQAVICLNPLLAYKFVLTDAAGNPLPNGTIDNIQNTASLNFTFTGVAGSAPNVLFTRNSSYTGGSGSFVTPLVQLITNIGAGDANLEWGFLSVLNNSATAGENVAIYGQGNKQTTTTGPTWAGVLEAREVVANNNPTTGLIGLEVDNRSNGTDANFNRLGIDVVCTRFNTSGAATTVSWGVRVQSNLDGANTTITNAFSAYQCNVGVAFDCANATVVSGSLRMAQGVPILFDATVTPQKLLSQGLGIDHIGTGGTLVNRLLNAGGLQVAAAQVVGPRINGYGTPTGGSHQASFAAGGITLANLAAAVAQLIVDLETHGLIGV
jgi:hypothetical protein